ncbi:kinase-like domain-containing protein [Mycena vulgaris]|nr:kinase-like domain-containing protein [Mycena vulgaris]
MQLAFEIGVYDDYQLDARHIIEHVVALIRSPEAIKAALKLEGQNSQQLLDVLHNTLHGDLPLVQEDRSGVQLVIQKLSRAYDKLPSSIFIHGVTDRDRYPCGGGGYADIYRALYRTKPVALKRLRLFIQGEDPRAIRSKFYKEAVIWQNLNHPNVLTLIGIYRDPYCLFMVSPWMRRGTILRHLSDIGRADVNRLLCQISRGLQYLHSQDVVHGDLRGQNILITDDWNACLIDFGFSRYSNASRSSTEGGSIRWMAPELLDLNIHSSQTRASDVYAFGCVCVELYTLEPPFSNIPMASDYTIICQILDGNRPTRPIEHPAMSDRLWQCVDTYWDHEPESRPSADDVVLDMELVLAESSHSVGPVISQGMAAPRVQSLTNDRPSTPPDSPEDSERSDQRNATPA